MQDTISPRLRYVLDEVKYLTNTGAGTREIIAALAEGRRVALDEECSPAVDYFSAELAAKLATVDVQGARAVYETMIHSYKCPGIILLSYTKLMHAIGSATAITAQDIRKRSEVIDDDTLGTLATAERLALLETEAFILLRAKDSARLGQICDEIAALDLDFPAFIDAELIQTLDDQGWPTLAAQLRAISKQLDTRSRDTMKAALRSRQ